MIIKLLPIFLLNLFIIKYINSIIKSINLFDSPDNNRKIHKIKTASIGGFIIFINLIFYYFLFVVLNHGSFHDYFLWLFAFCIFGIGFFDDKYKLNANLKFILFIFFAYLIFKIDNNLIITQLNFSFLNDNIGLGKFALIFSIISLVIFLNAFNMFDGINLQSSIYAIFVFSIFIFKGYFVDLSIIIIISLFFFLYLNYKNISFLGDNGSLLVAFLIAYVFMSSSNQDIFFADEILLIMLIPGLDLIRLFFIRLINKKSPFVADNDHFHHHLLKKFGLIKTNLTVLFINVLSYTLAVVTNSFLLFIILNIALYFFSLTYLKKQTNVQKL